MNDDQKKTDEIVASNKLVKQAENKQITNNNMEGKGGFGDHPESINRNGRPPKGWAWSELLEDIGEEIDTTTGKQFKELVGRRLWLEAISGNMFAVKELFNRMEGLPRVKMEFDGKVDMRIPELVALIDKMLTDDDTETDTNNQDFS